MNLLDFLPSEFLSAEFKLLDHQDNLVVNYLDGEYDRTINILDEGKIIGRLDYVESSFEKGKEQELAQILAPVFRPLPWDGYSLRVWEWVIQARNLHPSIFDWVGVYFRASWLLGEKSTDLILGPFVGEPTDHVRIPLNRGYCGMALRENKVINVDDVTKSDVHIACSLKTRSELVIPLLDEDGDSVAELDIDSNQLSAFTPTIEEKMREFAKTFPLP